MAGKAAVAAASPPPPLNSTAIFYMVLLAMQFGIQPILTRRYAPTGINRSAVVLMQEATKFSIALFMLYLSGNLKLALKGTLREEGLVRCIWIES
jgi:hypothetical protein